MSSFPTLSAAIWIPIVFGVILLLLGSGRSPWLLRSIALVGALLGLAVTLPLFTDFDRGTAAMQFVEQAPWIPVLDSTYHLGVDGLSVWFVLLTRSSRCSRWWRAGSRSRRRSRSSWRRSSSCRA